MWFAAVLVCICKYVMYVMFAKVVKQLHLWNMDITQFSLWKSLLQMDSNSLVNKRKTKRTNKQRKIYNEDWVAKLNCKIEFFVPCNGHQNCLNKSVLTTLDLFWCVCGLSSKLKSLWPLLIGRVQLPQSRSD